MTDRVLRGSRLGAVSYENDRNTDLAPRQSTTYDCPSGHSFRVPFAADAEIPPTWECRLCGKTAQRTGVVEAPPAKKTKPARTHMDMIRERRSTADLEEVLKEQLAARAAAAKKKSA